MQQATAPVPMRPFGRHQDVRVSAIGFGGHHLGDADSDGRLELFKTTVKYDGDLGRELHGFPSAQELPV